MLLEGTQSRLYLMNFVSLQLPEGVHTSRQLGAEHYLVTATVIFHLNIICPWEDRTEAGKFANKARASTSCFANFQAKYF